MKICFIHQNFPAQFRHIALHLAQNAENHVLTIGQKSSVAFPNTHHRVYAPARLPAKSTHHYLANAEMGVLNGQAVAKILYAEKLRGYQPDVIVGHMGWGETLYVKDVFPNVPLVNYCEFFYHATGADAGFDPEFPNTLDDIFRIRSKNTVSLLGLDACDAGISPTNWQKSLYPQAYHDKISVIHEGVNLAFCKPNPNVEITLPSGIKLSKQDKVVTYVARNLEPYRGFHTIMRALPHLQQLQPDCHVLIVGAEGKGYGRHDANLSYREKLCQEVTFDSNKVHFLGHLNYQEYLKVLQISSAHVYLTVPFVLSWSMLEAMAAGALVIGSDTPPVREVIAHEKNGLLVDFFDAKNLAATISQVLNKPAHYQTMIKEAYNLLNQRYSVEYSLQQYERFLKNLH